MPYAKRKSCFICDKKSLVNLSSHMKEIHNMSVGYAKKSIAKPQLFYGNSTSEKPQRSARLLYGRSPSERYQMRVPILYQYSFLAPPKKREYIQKRAPDDVVKLFREIFVNTINGNVRVKKRDVVRLKCEWLCRKVINGQVSNERARKLLSNKKLLRFLDVVIPYVIKHLTNDS